MKLFLPIKNLIRICTQFIHELKGEKTIKSETSKVFLVIFAILLTVGTFTISSSWKGSGTFDNIQNIYLKQYHSVGNLKQKSLEIIGIYYLLITDLDMTVLMEQMQRYDGLAEKFSKNLKELQVMLENAPESKKQKETLTLAKEIGSIFAHLNQHARDMTFALMEGNKESSKASFTELNKDIEKFLVKVDQFESMIENSLKKESNLAQKFLQSTSWAGFVIIFLGLFLTLKLISYLMKFLSVTLLPISNLMHNMRQAVFSIDKNLIVISPVSNYSNTVFGKEIVGNSINELLFKNLDPKGPVKASLDTAMGAVFGADDIQWMLMEDCFPSKIEYSSIGGDKIARILKLTYTPLWAKDGNLVSIMIVAEDITEIEKLREESLKKDGELNIIQSLMDMNKNEVAPFLNLSREQLNNTKELAARMAESKSNRDLLFRILHTLKGNSRMYKFNSIADAVHSAETTVVEINKKFGDNQTIPQEMYNELHSGIDSIETELGIYFSTANKLLGIENNYSSEKIEKFRTALIEAESFLWNDDNNDQKVMLGHVDKIFKTGSFFRIEDSFADFAAIVSSEIKPCEKRIMGGTLKPSLMNQFFKLGLCSPIEFEHSEWISLFDGIYNLSESYHWWVAGHKSGREYLLLRCRNIISQAELMTLAYPIAQAQKIQFQVANNSPLHEIKPLITSLWIYMAFVCQLDGLGTIDKKASQSLSPWTMQHGPTNHLFLSLASFFKKQEVSDVSFKFMAANFLPFPLENWEYFWGNKELNDAIETLFQMVRSPDLEANINTLRTVTDANAATVAILIQAKYSLVLLPELARLMIPKVQNIDSERFGLARKMVEVPSATLSNLIQQVQNISAIKTLDIGIENSKLSIQRTIDRMFDMPIKSICWKMAPMVEEVSNKLGKKAELKITGPDFNLPRIVLFDLRDAIVHMVRNSLDHGLELPEARLLSGKSEKGLIHIHSEEIVPDEVYELQITDDGHGIDVDKLTEKAVKTGVISDEVAKSLSNESKLDLIFIPSLSTKDEVTALSGRGVGMDSVKAIIERLGGKISIESRPGFGTKFILSFSRNRAISSLRNAA